MGLNLLGKLGKWNNELTGTSFMLNVRIINTKLMCWSLTIQTQKQRQMNSLCVVFIVTLTQAARQFSFPWFGILFHFVTFYFTLNTAFNGTLTQIWNSHYLFVFTQKQYPENFAFFILIILELLALAVCKFLKK